MGVQCQILINKAKEGVYRPRQAVTGKVKYYVDEQTEYQDVSLSLIGKGKCRWTTGSHKNRRTYRGTEDYIINHLNICNKRPEETIFLGGKYEYPFEFFLPEDIPRSYKDYTGSIVYRIELKFVKPSFFSFNKVFTAEIPVYSYVVPPQSEGPIIFGLDKTLFTLFDPDTPSVNLKAEIEKSCVTPGENINLSYIVTNNTDVEITSIETALYCYKTYTADCGRKKYFHEKVKSCEVEAPGIPERGVRSFKCILPTLPELYSIQQSKIISIEYKVRVTVRLPLPHINATVDIVVVIGEKIGSVAPTYDAEEPDEAPPTYWEAMTEGKEKTDEE